MKINLPLLRNGLRLRPLSLNHCFLRRATLVFSCLLLSLGSAEALLIDFNSYTTGSDLNGQPATGTKWSGGGADFRVTAESGMGGSTAVVTGTRSSGTTASAFAPSATDLPGFNGNTSIVDVSFSFRYVDLPLTTTSTTTTAAIQFGWDNADAATAVRFYLTVDGRIGYGSGTLIPGSTFQMDNTSTWTTITARLNYEEQTFTFSINGTPYITSGGSSTFGFRGESHSSIIRLMDAGSANFKSVAFDNISMTVIPEPSSVALLLLPGFAGMVALLKRSK